ncbi:bacteriocin immunity protein [Symbiopectobacterium purcellii]|uniref:Bacteriocin immunity protein n=1 Tax=Symbiopectobacterium purcellii TaxID=2871826 RepID=A0ABX9AFW1_9ENTR|nr:bacteriocin immunity protein [Symbiopectobacterium purcellii]QZN94052.1 bacteriocin immunity protein [Symbiopectobacterium purcellii]
MARFESIEDCTEKEFLDFVTQIYSAEYSTEEAHAIALDEFERISEHPFGSDLLYYPEAGKQGPLEVVKEIKQWRAKNGKPGFKPG